MKKLLVLIPALALLVTIAYADYTTFVTLEVTEMDCIACTGDLTGIVGKDDSIATKISTNGECNQNIQGSFSPKANTIAEGVIFTTNAVTLTEGSPYFFCLELEERSIPSNKYDLNTCTDLHGGGPAFTLGGTAQCNSIGFGYIGSDSNTDTIKLAFPFQA